MDRAVHHDPFMRTTLTLDHDVADFLKTQSRLQGRPLGLWITLFTRGVPS